MKAKITIGVIFFFLGALAMFFVGDILYPKQGSDMTEDMSVVEKILNRSEQIDVGDDQKEYHNKKFGFKIRYPDFLQVEEFKEGTETYTLVFQEPGQKNGFQMFITPYQDTTISKERLAYDTRGGSIEEPMEVVLGGGQRALAFWSNDPTLGKLREVWFIKNGFLYEVTTYAEEDEALAKVLSTLSFE